MAVVIRKILQQGVRYVEVVMGLAITPQAVRRRTTPGLAVTKVSYAAHITALSDIGPDA